MLQRTYRCCSARTGSSFYQKQHSHLECIDFRFFSMHACITPLQTMLRKLFSEHVVPFSGTCSTARFKRWRMIAGKCSLLRAILFSTTNFLRMGRKMCFDGKLALNDVSFNKSDSNHIPVAVRSAVGLLYSREITKEEVPERLSRAKVPVLKRKGRKAESKK